jgi:DNA-binding CsgD family transcriptional regulator
MASRDAIVGREAELRRLRDVVSGPGAPSVVFLEGDPGVGKTVLLEAVAAEASESGSRVLRARPTAAEAGSSYTALDDLLRPVIDDLRRLPAPQRRPLAAALLLEDAAGPVDPRAVALGCRSLIGALSGPTLLAIDDWQWLDAASASVLEFVLRRLEPGGAKLIATARSGEADEALSELLHGLPPGLALELTLAPLDARELGRLVHARIGERMPPAALQRLHRDSAGNPLTALELVRAPGAEATDIRRLLARRLAALSPAARAALRIVAAMAEPTFSDVDPAGVDEALAADVLVRDGDRLRFTHPLVAAVVEDLTPPSEWRSIHARLAESATGQEQRARHLAAAADGPDEAVAIALVRAAAEAGARGARIAAAELAERAAALTPAVDAEVRLRRLLDAGELLMSVGLLQRARALLEEVRREADAGPLHAEALYRLAYLVSDDSGPELVEEALGHAGDDDDLLARIHLSASMFASMSGRLGGARIHGEAAVRHAEAGGRGALLAQGLKQIAFERLSAGEGTQRELLLRAAALERETGEYGRDDTALEILGLQLIVEGDFAEARRVLTGELARVQEQGYLEHEAFGLLLLAEVEVRAGRWAAAEAHARGALELTLGAGLWNTEAAVHACLALVEAHLGRLESARAYAETGRRQADALGDIGFSTICARILGFVALSAGDGEDAVRHLAPLPARDARLGIREPAMSLFEPDLAEALVLVGDLDAARAVQADLERRGRQLDRPWAIATALRCRGLIAAAEGRPGDALADFGEALAMHDDVPQPFDRARTLLALGIVQRRAKQRAEARTTLEAALAVFEELGAVVWAERARGEIARLGGRRARDRDELTEAERRIAELAAGGRSNREIAAELFVSERTVEANLTRAYRKLGVRSRTELARRLPAG